jgi:hypothetical protein
MAHHCALLLAFNPPAFANVYRLACHGAAVRYLLCLSRPPTICTLRFFLTYFLMHGMGTVTEFLILTLAPLCTAGSVRNKIFVF